MKASFEEKSAWIQLFSLVAVLGVYFVVAGRMMAQGTVDLTAFGLLFVVAIVMLVISLTVGHIVAAIGGRPEGRDERDRLIGWRAQSNASWVLGAGVLTAITGMFFSIDNVWIAHLLLISMLLAEVMKLVMQLVYYRGGV